MDKNQNGTVLRYISVMIILLTAVLGLYEHFVLIPRQAETFILSPWRILNGSIGRPAFWAASGSLISSIILQICSGVYEKRRLSGICTWIGILFIALYTALTLFVLFFSGTDIINSVQGTFYHGAAALSVWLTQNAQVFVIPGILLGVGLSSETDR